jgi:hypothetical protein
MRRNRIHSGPAVRRLEGWYGTFALENSGNRRVAALRCWDDCNGPHPYNWLHQIYGGKAQG